LDLLAKVRNPKTHYVFFVEVICLNIKTVNMTFHVSDFSEAVSFYENILGLRKKSQWHNYAVFDLCGMMLALEPAVGKGTEKGVPDIYLQVDNVDDAYRELKSKGVRILTEPQDQSWGARTAKFADSDGNMFILVQLTK
jgi:catechol 2,3-dioxygenase-like lactoylglutathione lyase family enzyme